MAETHDLHGLLAVQVLHALFKVDMQVLIGVVVVHVDRHFKIHAVDLIHQLDKALEVYAHGEVHGDAQKLFDLIAQLLRAALGIGVVELVAVAHQRVARQAHKVDGLIYGVKAHQNIRVAAAGVIVDA